MGEVSNESLNWQGGIENRNFHIVFERFLNWD